MLQRCDFFINTNQMKKQILKSIAIMAMALVSVGAVAQSDIDKEIEELIELQNVRQSMVETTVMQYQALVKMGQANEAKVKAMAEECVDVMLPKIIELQKELYKENYTLDELKELTKFYTSAVGQKSLKLASKFSILCAQIVTDPDIINKIQEITMKHLMPK